MGAIVPMLPPTPQLEGTEGRGSYRIVALEVTEGDNKRIVVRAGRIMNGVPPSSWITHEAILGIFEKTCTCQYRQLGRGTITIMGREVTISGIRDTYLRGEGQGPLLTLFRQEFPGYEIKFV